MDLAQYLDVLHNRMGQWYNYTPLIAALNQHGFTPSSIEEATGISDVEQNHLVVAAQVHDPLLKESTTDLIPYFDSYSGPEMLYKLRLLITCQHRPAMPSTPGAQAT
jgi:hypothetical protein